MSERVDRGRHLQNGSPSRDLLFLPAGVKPDAKPDGLADAFQPRAFDEPDLDGPAIVGRATGIRGNDRDHRAGLFSDYHLARYLLSLPRVC